MSTYSKPPISADKTYTNTRIFVIVTPATLLIETSV
jgi:hypothetical protein